MPWVERGACGAVGPWSLSQGPRKSHVFFTCTAEPALSVGCSAESMGVFAGGPWNRERAVLSCLPPLTPLTPLTPGWTLEAGGSCSACAATPGRCWVLGMTLRLPVPNPAPAPLPCACFRPTSLPVHLCLRGLRWESEAHPPTTVSFSCEPTVCTVQAPFGGPSVLGPRLLREGCCSALSRGLVFEW